MSKNDEICDIYAVAARLRLFLNSSYRMMNCVWISCNKLVVYHAQGFQPFEENEFEGVPIEFRPLNRRKLPNYEEVCG